MLPVSEPTQETDYVEKVIEDMMSDSFAKLHEQYSQIVDPNKINIKMIK